MDSGILRTGSFEVHLRYIKNEGGVVYLSKYATY